MLQFLISKEPQRRHSNFLVLFSVVINKTVSVIFTGLITIPDVFNTTSSVKCYQALTDHYENSLNKIPADNMCISMKVTKHLFVFVIV